MTSEDQEKRWSRWQQTLGIWMVLTVFGLLALSITAEATHVIPEWINVLLLPAIMPITLAVYVVLSLRFERRHPEAVPAERRLGPVARRSWKQWTLVGVMWMGLLVVRAMGRLKVLSRTDAQWIELSFISCLFLFLLVIVWRERSRAKRAAAARNASPEVAHGDGSLVRAEGAPHPNSAADSSGNLESGPSARSAATNERLEH